MEDRYSKNEIEALDKKLEHPDEEVRCPRCGNLLIFREVGNSCEVKCQTEGCLKDTIRGL